jgi:hypothetical protein
VELSVVESQPARLEGEMAGLEELVRLVEPHYGITPSPRSSARACAP